MHLALGIAFMAVAVALAIWIARRKFARTNEAGVERHRSYGGMVAATALERIVRWIVVAAVVAGALLVIAK